MPTTWAAWRSQMSGAVRVLRAHGVEVHVVPRFTPAEERHLAHLDSEGMLLFPRDPLFVVGPRVFELGLQGPHRRKERFPLRRFLRKRLEGTRTVVRTLAEPEGVEPPVTLEGGDCLVGDGTVYVGIGGASTAEGAEWLAQALPRGWRVETVAVSPDFPHLDCALALLREGLGLVAPDGLPEGLPRTLRRGWRWIEVDRADALGTMAVNVLPLDERTVLLPSRASSVGGLLEQRGHTVVRVPFDAVTPVGGGIRCWSQPLVRRG